MCTSYIVYVLISLFYNIVIPFSHISIIRKKVQKFKISQKIQFSHVCNITKIQCKIVFSLFCKLIAITNSLHSASFDYIHYTMYVTFNKCI